MNPRSTFFLSVLVGALPLLAQGAIDPAFASSLARAHGVSAAADGATVARGPGYKATFDRDGFTFLPALGDAARREGSLGFRFVDVHLGELRLDDGRPAMPEIVNDTHVSFLRGGVVEHYATRPEGIEQSFVVTNRPTAGGDLVVRGEITTALQPTTRDDGTLFFHDGEVGGVTLGAVTGIAADGQRCAGSMQFADGMLQLRLPAAFVAAAAFPLVLDPLFGTGFLASPGGSDDKEGEVAYEGTAQAWLAVWRVSFAASIQDIRGQRFDAAGNLLGVPFDVNAVTTASRAAPAVATIALRDRFLVVWQEGPSPFGPWEVRQRVVPANGGLMPAPGLLSSGGSCSQPCVTGDRSIVSGNAVVAWRRAGTGIEFRTVTMNATGALSLGASTTAFTVGANQTVLSGPRCAKSFAGLSSAIMTVEVGDSSGTAILGRSLFLTSASLSAVTALAFETSGRLEHAIDTDGLQWRLVFGGSQLRTRSVQASSGVLPFGPITALTSTGNLATPAIAWLGDRYLVAWHELLGGFDDQVRGLAMQADGTVSSTVFTAPTVTQPNQRSPSLGSQFHGAGASGEGLLLVDESNPAPPWSGDLAAHRFRAMVGLPPVVLSPSCVGGGTAGTNGPFSPGNAAFRFTLSGGDPVAPFAILLLSAGNLAPVTCGCTFTQSLASFAMPAVAGSAEHLFPLPPAPTLLGFELEYQWLLFGSAVSPCALLPNITVSDRVRLTMAE